MKNESQHYKLDKCPSLPLRILTSPSEEFDNFLSEVDVKIPVYHRIGTELKNEQVLKYVNNVNINGAVHIQPEGLVKMADYHQQSKGWNKYHDVSAEHCQKHPIEIDVYRSLSSSFAVSIAWFWLDERKLGIPRASVVGRVSKFAESFSSSDGQPNDNFADFPVQNTAQKETWTKQCG